MNGTRYLDEISARLDMLRDQAPAIERAAELCATTIARGDLVHVFGAGHSRMAAEEAYPRIGALVGFHPVVELAVTNFASVVGANGVRQAIFLERVPEYGRLIYEESGARVGDAAIVFSSSGVEHIILDFAGAARDDGVPVVGVTSLEYSAAAAAERGVERLADRADQVIDNKVPAGDALIELDGMSERIGPSASILNLAIMDSITVTTAARLLAGGDQPMAFASPHLAGEESSHERFDACLAEYSRRTAERRRR